MKKILLMLLCAAMLPTMAWAEGGDTSDGLHWDLTGGVLTISGTGEMMNYSTTKVGGLTPSPWYASRASITKVVFGEGITKIGDYACYGCACTEVEIASSVKDLDGTNIFLNCSTLVSITCKALVPPTCKTNWKGESSLFKNVPAECVLYVPAASVEAYKSADIWKDQVFIANTTAISDTPSDVEYVRAASKAQKVMRDGQLLILQDGHYYDLTGHMSK